jgi:hypothetical protein
MVVVGEEEAIKQQIHVLQPQMLLVVPAQQELLS